MEQIGLAAWYANSTKGDGGGGVGSCYAALAFSKRGDKAAAHWASGEAATNLGERARWDGK